MKAHVLLHVRDVPGGPAVVTPVQFVHRPTPEHASGDGDAGVVVRVYEEGKRRGVRDPRTGVRESHLVQVLDEGRIDAFLLAVLREGVPAV